MQYPMVKRTKERICWLSTAPPPTLAWQGVQTGCWCWYKPRKYQQIESILNFPDFPRSLNRTSSQLLLHGALFLNTFSSKRSRCAIFSPRQHLPSQYSLREPLFPSQILSLRPLSPRQPRPSQASLPFPIPAPPATAVHLKMRRTGDPEYSHDKTVAAITSFFQFVQRMHDEYLDRELEYPPPEGWPQLTPEILGGLGYSPAVIDLLRHIPYFMGERTGPPEILDSTQLITWAHPDAIPTELSEEWVVKNRLARLSREDEDVTLNSRPPAYVVQLAEGGRYGYDVHLDTHRAAIVCYKTNDTWPNYFPSGDLEQYTDDDQSWEFQEAPWYAGEVYGIETFFELIKEEFRNMHSMPTLDGSGEVHELATGDVLPSGKVRDDVDVQKRAILKGAGWPGEDGELGVGWDVEKAMKDWDERNE